MVRRCRIEFGPHWISTRGPRRRVLIQQAVLKIKRVLRWIMTPLLRDMGSLYYDLNDG